MSYSEKTILLGYSRCSAAGQSHASQLDALERAGCERIFVETVSGTSTDREELTKLLAFARDGGADGVQDSIAVLRLDRLGRDMRQVLALVDELTRRGIGLVSLTENLDSTTPSGRLAMHMMAALSQYELEQKSAACSAGRAAILARGGRLGGRPRSLDETKVKVARALIADGQLSMVQVAEQVGVAASTLYRTLPGGRAAATATRDC